MHRRTFQTTLIASALALSAFGVAAQGKGDIKIAVIQSKTGPLEAYAKQMIAGSLPPVSSLAVAEKAIYWVYFSGPSYPVGIHGIVKPVNP